MTSWTNPQRPVGVLRPEHVGEIFELRRAEPPPDLARYVEHFWSVRWDLNHPRAYASQVISHPSVHLTAESGIARFGYDTPVELVHGVVTTRFDIALTGSGSTFGIKFSTGAFTALTGVPAHTITDRIVPASTISEAARSLAAIREVTDADDKLDVLIGTVRAMMPDAPDPVFGDVAALIDDIRSNPSLASVAQVAERSGRSERGVQSLMRNYVGVGAKWMIRRCRLHDAIERIHADPATPIASLAAELGWYDQAHFTRDFTDAVGVSPVAYAKREGWQ